MVNAWEEWANVTGSPSRGKREPSAAGGCDRPHLCPKSANFPIFLNRATIMRNRIMRMSAPVRLCPCCCQES